MAKPTIWTDTMLTELRQMREAGVPAGECAAALGVGYQAVLNQMARMGLRSFRVGLRGAGGIERAMIESVSLPEEEEDDFERDPLPPFHPVAMDVLGLTMGGYHGV